MTKFFFPRNTIAFVFQPKSFLFFLFFVSISISNSWSQSVLHRLVEESSLEFAQADFKTTELEDLSLKQYVSDYKLVEIDNRDIAALYSSKSSSLTLEIPTTDGAYLLKLIKHDFTSDDYKVRTNNNQLYNNELSGVHYQGVIEGKLGSFASVSIFQDEVSILAATKENGNIVVKKMKDQEAYISYFEKHILIENKANCSVDESTARRLSFPKFDESVNVSRTSNCVNVHIEANYELYQDKGSSVANTTNYLEGLFNVISTLYTADGMTIKLSFVNVWTVANDPFTDANSSDGLNSIRNYFQGGATMNGDLAHLVSGGNGNNGGRAYLGVLCSSIGLRTAYSNINGSYNPFPTYSWDVNVFAHEMGHNLGSAHTHQCVWNGNNTQIDDCGSVYFVNNDESPEPCYDETNEILPATGGTVMSYCHVVSTGINTANGFGPQVRALLISNIENANCLSSCSTLDCFPPLDVTVSNITSTSALITWLSSGNDIDSFKIDYEINGGASQTVYSSVNNISLSGLSSNTQYTVAVSSICSNESLISLPVSFVTDCNVALTLPYEESFEQNNGDWTAYGENNSWAWGTPTKNVIQGAADGIRAWTTGGLGTTSYSANEESYLQSPCFDLSDAEEVMLELSIWWEVETNWDGAVIQYSITSGNSWVTIGSFGDPNNWYNNNDIDVEPAGSAQGWSGFNGNGSGNWIRASHEVNELVGEESVKFRVAFASDGYVESDGFAIDDVMIWDPLASNICYEDTIYETSCEEANTGTVVNTYESVTGCDSIVTTITTLLQSDETTIELTTCNPEEQGIDILTLQNQAGCDSIVTINTSLLQSDEVTVELSSCDRNEVGTEILNLINQLGCDSIVTIITSSLPTTEVVFMDYNNGDICLNDAEIDLQSLVSPNGGDYSGSGMNGSLFNPTTAGIGEHEIVYSFTNNSGCTNSDTIYLNVDVCAGISQFLDVNSLTVYPNPANDFVVLSFKLMNLEPVKINILDVTGRKIMQADFEPSRKSFSERINLDGLANGTYSIHIELNGNYHIEKIIHLD